MKLDTLTDDKLLSLFNSVKAEMMKRKSQLFVKLLKEYWDKNYDNFDKLNWLDTLNYFKELGYSEKEFQYLLDECKNHRIFAYAIIPSRSIEYRGLQIYWDGWK